MRAAWEEERVAAAAERTALEQALAEQGTQHAAAAAASDASSSNDFAATGSASSSKTGESGATAGPPRKVVMPAPPPASAKRPGSAHSRRSGGFKGQRTVVGQRQEQPPPLPRDRRQRPSSAREARRPSARAATTKRRVASARRPKVASSTAPASSRSKAAGSQDGLARVIGAPQRAADVARSDAARTLLEEWRRADEQARGGRRELRKRLATDATEAAAGGGGGGGGKDDEVADAVMETQRCARHRSYRRVSVKLVEALNADALGALRRCERERAIKLLLEARRVLTNDCFAKTPRGEMLHQGGGRRADSGDGRCLHEWVRLHSCTLNNLGIAHRDRARATSKFDAKSANALARVKAGAKAGLLAAAADANTRNEKHTLNQKYTERLDEPGMTLALRFVDRARALEHDALRALGQRLETSELVGKVGWHADSGGSAVTAVRNAAEEVDPDARAGGVVVAASRRGGILKHTQANGRRKPRSSGGGGLRTSDTPVTGAAAAAVAAAAGKAVVWGDLQCSTTASGLDLRTDPEARTSTSDTVALIRGNAPADRGGIGDMNLNVGDRGLGAEFAQKMLDVYGIGPVAAVPLVRATYRNILLTPLRLLFSVYCLICS